MGRVGYQTRRNDVVIMLKQNGYNKQYVGVGLMYLTTLLFWAFSDSLDSFRIWELSSRVKYFTNPAEVLWGGKKGYHGAKNQGVDDQFEGCLRAKTLRLTNYDFVLSRKKMK